MARLSRLSGWQDYQDYQVIKIIRLARLSGSHDNKIATLILLGGNMKIEKFEDMKVWNDAREFCKSIYLLSNNANFKKDYGLKEQIQRAVVSILTNIAEGFERDSNSEFVKFLNYSKGSAGEVRALLYIAHDLNYITNEEFENNFRKSISIIKQLSNFIKYLRKSTKTKNSKINQP